uniref:ABC1 domain-containing protein n=1 Tax=Heterorhabditis bacteriophora TaxID=37862 RepID=A0A1I7XQM2_HETBA
MFTIVALGPYSEDFGLKDIPILAVIMVIKPSASALRWCQKEAGPILEGLQILFRSQLGYEGRLIEKSCSRKCLKAAVVGGTIVDPLKPTGQSSVEKPSTFSTSSTDALERVHVIASGIRTFAELLAQGYYPGSGGYTLSPSGEKIYGSKNGFPVSQNIISSLSKVADLVGKGSLPLPNIEFSSLINLGFANNETDKSKYKTSKQYITSSNQKMSSDALLDTGLTPEEEEFLLKAAESVDDIEAKEKIRGKKTSHEIYRPSLPQNFSIKTDNKSDILKRSKESKVPATRIGRLISLFFAFSLLFLMIHTYPTNYWVLEQFSAFEDHPFAAASIGQARYIQICFYYFIIGRIVHEAILKDGRKVAVKVQYPGVAEELLENFATCSLIQRTILFPRYLNGGLCKLTPTGPTSTSEFTQSLPRMILLDFGASRSYPKPFVDKYMKIIKAASDGDTRKIIEYIKYFYFHRFNLNYIFILLVTTKGLSVIFFHFLSTCKCKVLFSLWKQAGIDQVKLLSGMPRKRLDAVDYIMLMTEETVKKMLPDLSPHLHTKECNILIHFLQKCHEEKSVGGYFLFRYKTSHISSFLGKMFGQCSYWDEAVWQCTKKERIWRRNNNPQYGKRFVELRNLPEAYWTPALKKLKEQGLIQDTQNEGCRI